MGRRKRKGGRISLEERERLEHIALIPIGVSGCWNVALLEDKQTDRIENTKYLRIFRLCEGTRLGLYMLLW